MTNFQNPKSNAERVYPSRPFISEIPKLQRLVAAKGLTGLASDTKWNELITFMQNVPLESWCAGYRYRCIDSDFVSEWDYEWWCHLPFPFISVMWLELSFEERISRGRLISSEVIDHSPELERLLLRIGLDFKKGRDAIRIFGYAPRDRNGFNQVIEAE